MRQLERVQTLLGRALRQSAPLEGDAWNELEEVVADGARLSARQQAEIYREQFWLRHRDCLLEDYPALARLLGPEAFDDFARSYLEAHPPTSFTLRDLGAQVADFAASWDWEGFDPSVVGPARDAARYELAFVDLFDGPDLAPAALEVALAQVAAIPAERWPTVRLVLHPLLTLLALHHPVDELRRALREGAEPPAVLPEQASWLALWRGPDRVIREERLTETEHEVLAALRAGASLGAALERAAQGMSAERQDALGAELGDWFRRWAERGWIVSLR